MTAKPQKSPELVPASRHGLALEGFFNIMARWGVGNGDARRILGNPAERTFFQWKTGKAARLPDDTLRRIGYIAGLLGVVHQEMQFAGEVAAADAVHIPQVCAVHADQQVVLVVVLVGELPCRVAVAGDPMLRQLAPRRGIDRIAYLLPAGRR